MVVLDTVSIYLDTCTVMDPDTYFIISTDNELYPIYNFTCDIENSVISPKDSDLYVNPLTGNNNNTGLTPEDPLQSIAYAYSSIAVDSIDRNTIYLSDGLYSDSTNNEKFPLNIRPFVNIVGQSMENTILDGRYKSRLIKGNNKVSNYQFSELTLQKGGHVYYSQTYGDAGLAMLYNENDDVILNNILFLKGHGYSGFHQLGIGASNNVLVSNCVFSENIGAYAVRTGQQGDTTRIRNCIFINNKPDSSQQWPWGGAIAIYSWETDTYIENCLFTGNNNYNVSVSASFTDPGNHYFINCTFSENTKLSPNYSLGTLDANTFIYNSIIFNEGRPNPIALGWHEAIDTISLEIYHSLLENGESSVFIEPGGPTRFIYDNSNIPGDPLFDSTAIYPFSLPAGSPCIDAGTPLWFAGAGYPYVVQEDSMLLLHINENKVIELSNVDLGGNPRLWNNAIDMGAYEYGPWVRINEFQSALSKNNQLFVYPNPFSENPQISYRTSREGRVQIRVYDIQGRYVAGLLDSKQPEGKGVFTWTTSNSSAIQIKPGTYLISLRIDGETVVTKKVVKN
jgi:hypothetical protein